MSGNLTLCDTRFAYHLSVSRYSHHWGGLWDRPVARVWSERDHGAHPNHVQEPANASHGSGTYDDGETAVPLWAEIGFMINPL